MVGRPGLGTIGILALAAAEIVLLATGNAQHWGVFTVLWVLCAVINLIAMALQRGDEIQWNIVSRGLLPCAVLAVADLLRLVPSSGTALDSLVWAAWILALTVSAYVALEGSLLAIGELLLPRLKVHYGAGEVIEHGEQQTTVFTGFNELVFRIIDHFYYRPMMALVKKDDVLQMVILKSFYVTIEKTVEAFFRNLRRFFFLSVLIGFGLAVVINLVRLYNGFLETNALELVWWPLLLIPPLWVLGSMIPTILSFYFAEWNRRRDVHVFFRRRYHNAAVTAPEGIVRHNVWDTKSLGQSDRYSPGQKPKQEASTFIGKVFDAWLSTWSVKWAAKLGIEHWGVDVGLLDMGLVGLLGRVIIDYCNSMQGTSICVHRIADLAQDVSDAKTAFGRAFGENYFNTDALKQARFQGMGAVIIEMDKMGMQLYQQYVRRAAELAKIPYDDMLKQIEEGDLIIDLLSLWDKDPGMWDRKTGNRILDVTPQTDIRRETEPVVAEEQPAVTSSSVDIASAFPDAEE